MIPSSLAQTASETISEGTESLSRDTDEEFVALVDDDDNDDIPTKEQEEETIKSSSPNDDDITCSSILSRPALFMLFNFILFSVISGIILIHRRHINKTVFYEVLSSSLPSLKNDEIVARGFGGTTFHTDIFEKSSEMKSSEEVGIIAAKDTNTYQQTISLVISHCDKSLEWIPSSFSHEKYKIESITIITKCDKDIEGLRSVYKMDTLVIIDEQPNIGRCDHSYAHYISSELSRNAIDRQKNGNDIVIFLKDNNYLLQPGLSRSIPQIIDIASTVGFGCFVQPKCWFCGRAGGGNEARWHNILPLTLHDNDILESYTMENYQRIGRDENGDFLSNAFPTMKNWTEHVGIKRPNVESVPVCYGGTFAAQKRQFFQQSESTWANITETLSRGNNIVEGHYAERSWATMLTYEESIVTVSSLLSPLKHEIVPAGGVATSRVDGMLLVHSFSRYGGVKFADYYKNVRV